VTGPPSFDPTRHPRRLNLGCGYDRRDGYLNVDLNAFHEPDLVADACDLAALPNDYYLGVVAQDVLEHLPRLRTREALCEWNRVLAPDGVLEIRTTNLLGLLGLFDREDLQSVESQERLIQCLFGTQVYDGDFHLTAFTEPLLRAYLEESGFEVQSVEARDQWLFDVRARKVRTCDAGLRERRELLATPGDERFVARAYEVLLGRPADPGGVAFFLARLREGDWTRRSVLQVIESSGETRRASAPSTSRTAPEAAASSREPCTRVSFRLQPEFRPHAEGGYALHELLDHHDTAFVANAYRAILGREPDPEGLRRHLDDLRRARATKTEVLGRLRFSEEGRRRKVEIAGLRRRYLLRRAFRVPVLGYALQWLATAIRLPSLVQRQDGFEAYALFLLELLAADADVGLATEAARGRALASRVDDLVAKSLPALETRTTDTLGALSQRLARAESGGEERAQAVAHLRQALAQLDERAEETAAELVGRADGHEARMRDASIESAEILGTVTARLGRLESVALGAPSAPENAVYDAQTVAVMRRCLRRDSNCIDVGCHEARVLAHILAIAPDGTHFAFEPLPSLAGRLRDRFEARHPKLHIAEIALSDETGESSFQHVVSHPGYSGLRPRRYDLPDVRVEEIRVRTDRLDHLVPVNLRVDFVKIDVEGGELGVLLGAAETLRRHKPIVVFEHGLGAADHYGSTPEEVWDLLADCGLGASLMERWLRGEGPLGRKEFVEQFCNGWNYYFIAHP
jgi:FkbM family methyltransferase